MKNMKIDYTVYQVGDLVQWVDPLYDLYDETRSMKVYGIVVGHNESYDAKVFWFDKLESNVCCMPKNEIILVSRASNEKHVLKEEQMVVNSIRSPYVYRVNKINSNINKKENSRDKRWLCVHCKAGIVYKLPARCPECDRMLGEEINRNK